MALIAAVLIHSQYINLKLHPVYFTDDVLPHHPVWHSAYVGLQYSPELYGFPVRQELMGSDELGLDGAMVYLQSVHFIGNEQHLPLLEALKAGGYYSRWNGDNPKWGLHDQIMRQVFFQIARKHPLKMIYMYMVKKPIAIWDVSIDLVRRSDQHLKRLVLVGGAVAALLWIVFGSRRDLLEAAQLVPVGAVAVMTSLLPCIWAFPVAWSVTDGLLLVFGLVVFVIGMSVAACYLVARQVVFRT
jgi:hypothetical protein